MNPIFGVGHEIYELKLKRTKNFFWRKLKFFRQKNEAVILDDGNFVGPKSSLYLCCSSRKRTVSVSFISFEKYELRMRKNFSNNFLSSFLLKNTKYEKKLLTSFSGQIVGPIERLYNLRNHGPGIRSQFCDIWDQR